MRRLEKAAAIAAVAAFLATNLIFNLPGKYLKAISSIVDSEKNALLLSPLPDSKEEIDEAAVGESKSSSRILQLSDIKSGEQLLSLIRQHENGKSGSSQRQCTFDVLSIGSININQTSLTSAQHSTWADNRHRRLFISAVEHDDPDPLCYNRTTFGDARAIVKKCKSKGLLSDLDKFNKLSTAFLNFYSNPRFLKKRSNPSGWICAQRRMPFALSTLASRYRAALQLGQVDFQEKAEEIILPDYLLLVDDDTALDLDILSSKLCGPSHHPFARTSFNVSKTGLKIPDENHDDVNQVYSSPNQPTVYAGCHIRSFPADLLTFTYPFGGFGTMFSRGSLLRFITPLHCEGSQDQNSDRGNGKSTNLSTLFEHNACGRLQCLKLWHELKPKQSTSRYSNQEFVNQCSSFFSTAFTHRLKNITSFTFKLEKENDEDHSLYHIGEGHLFESGMSISDLMGAYSAAPDYCLHSDWGIGYFVNFFNISRHVVPDGDWWNDVERSLNIKELRLFAFDESSTYAKGKNNCLGQHYQRCNSLQIRNTSRWGSVGKVNGVPREHVNWSSTTLGAVCHGLTADDMSLLFSGDGNKT